MEKEKTELEKLREEIKQLEKREKEYFKWLRKNLDSQVWYEIKSNWNEINTRIYELREERDQIILNNL